MLKINELSKEFFAIQIILSINIIRLGHDSLYFLGIFTIYLPSTYIGNEREESE